MPCNKPLLTQGNDMPNNIRLENFNARRIQDFSFGSPGEAFNGSIAEKHGIHIAVIVNALPRLQIMNRQQPEYFYNQSLEDIFVGFMPYFTRKEIKVALKKMQISGWFEGGKNE